MDNIKKTFQAMKSAESEYRRAESNGLDRMTIDMLDMQRVDARKDFYDAMAEIGLSKFDVDMIGEYCAPNNIRILK